ncbi:hypothetical protein CHS0354_002569, partial [Potamilus streckersoni]
SLCLGPGPARQSFDSSPELFDFSLYPREIPQLKLRCIMHRPTCLEFSKISPMELPPEELLLDLGLNLRICLSKWQIPPLYHQLGPENTTLEYGTKDEYAYKQLTKEYYTGVRHQG